MKTSTITALAVSAALLSGCSAGPVATEQSASGKPPTTLAPYNEPPAAPMPSTSTSTSSAQTQTPAVTKNPVEFGKTFVAAAYTWDTRTGTDLTEALKRIDYMATDELAAQFVAPENAARGATWNEAARHQAYTEPKVTLVPKENQALIKPQPGTKRDGYMVSWDWVGPGGYRQDGGKDLVILTLVKTKQGWKVSSFEPTPLQ